MKTKTLFLLILTGLLLTGCIERPPETTTSTTTPTTTLIIQPINLSGIKSETLSFTGYYSLAPLDVELKTAQYNLPLASADISNFNDFKGKITLSDGATALLERNGFVVVENPFNPGEESITQPYETLKDREIPVFITSDSLLHLYHIQFDETLRQIEEREFYDAIWNISNKLLKDSVEGYNAASGDLKEAYKRDAAYLTVGLSLLKPTRDQLCDLSEWECQDPGTASAYFTEEDLGKYKFTIPDFVREEVEEELMLIEKHEGFSDSPIFIYKEDYSQYVPRGHYTRSEKLKNYFRAFMWYGRISMILKGDPAIPVGETCQNCKNGFISAYDARIQTMGASLITSRFGESQELRDKWDRIYSVTAFYVGLSDDLGPYEYIEAMNHVFGDRFKPADLTTEKIGELKAKLAEYRTPEIYGGTGLQYVSAAGGPDEVLTNTKGFRLMGQRFIPDSYMFQNLVYGYVSRYLGEDEPFTMVFIDGVGPARGFPRGLDVMSLLGSGRAAEILEEGDDTNYKNYSTQYTKLKGEVDSFNASDWNKNLYWSWLYALKPLLKEFDTGYPSFMQTTAWQDKELTTALASWTELRHDTILYAKQSYTMHDMAMPMSQKPVVGYVEPVPEFYNRLLALTRMTNRGLDEMDVLDNSAKYRLDNLERILKRLVNISIDELENRELTKEDYDFIKDFGENLGRVIEGVDEKAKKTTIVADVHTDGNTNQVLEEGVGYVKLIAVAYKVPDGRILLGAGPVMSYYEFKHPMSDRLTDENWREMLETGKPEEPQWVPNFSD
ncbi:MAG: DUF3160 domain-containing protein [Candidatus Altiarchaeota archaeon]|nr:DUF3160 domain-containing protein [Candidatus Altiarchaeota archaeon]